MKSAVVMAEPIATIVGTMVGTSIGGNVGRSMDETDRLNVSRSLETVRTGVPQVEKFQTQANHYSMVPTSTMRKVNNLAGNIRLTPPLAVKPRKYMERLAEILMVVGK